LIKARKRLKKEMMIYENKSTKNIKKAMAVGVNGVIPTVAVGNFVESAGVNILGAEVAEHTVTATAAFVAKSGIGISTKIIAGVACAVVAAGGIGGLAISKAHSESTANDVASASAPTQQVAAEEIVTYSGDPHIIFANAAGEDSSVNPVSIKALDENAALANVAYIITNGANETVLTGEGESLSAAVISSLPEGSYQISFTLTEDTDATVRVSRSFQIYE
jgi:hypothetical protein